MKTRQRDRSQLPLPPGRMFKSPLPPAGEVPVLEGADGRVIADSERILDYLTQQPHGA
jgi:glutathione S-transferase